MATDETGTGRRRYDRVIVDPHGVFLLETTNLNGVLEIRDGVAWLRRRPAPGAERPLQKLRQRALADAAIVAAEFTARTGRPAAVTAVVVVWSAFPAGVIETEGVAYVHGSRLGGWLAARPTTLDRTAVTELGAALTALRRSGDARAERSGSRPRVRGG